MFKHDDPEHAKFLPVKNWIESGSAKLVIGGATYKKELIKLKTILGVISEYERRGRVYRAPDDAVDAEEKIVKEIEPSKDFDDPHLVALVRITGCRVICIRDPRSHRFLRAAKFYRSSKHRPKLYTREKNKTLLCNENMKTLQ
jgi:hypothetical protein